MSECQGVWKNIRFFNMHVSIGYYLVSYQLSAALGSNCSVPVISIALLKKKGPSKSSKSTSRINIGSH